MKWEIIAVMLGTYFLLKSNYQISDYVSQKNLYSVDGYSSTNYIFKVAY